MTTPAFRFIGTGRRRRLGDGRVRSLGAPLARYLDVTGSTALGVDTGGAARPVVPMVGETWLSFVLAGSLTKAGTVGRTTLSIGVAGALSSSVSVQGSALLGVNLLGALRLSQRLGGSTGMQFVAAGRLLPSVRMYAATGLGVGVIGQLAVAAALRGRGDLGVNVTGLLTAKVGQKWRDLWREAYDKRQALLNAIDANNRYLAKQAGDQATATASALVLTNTNVTTVDDKVTAVAGRTTALESSVNNPATGLAATASGLNALTTSVSLQQGQINAQALDISSVRASVGATSGNLITNAGFESDTFGWVIASDSLVSNVADSSYKLYRNRNGQRPGGINVLTWQSNTTLSSGTVVIRSNSVPSAAGTRYCVQAAGDRPSFSTLSFGLDFLNSSGGVITGGPSVTATPGYVIESAFAVAPAGAVALRVWLRSQVTGTIPTPAFSVIRPMVSVAAAEQTTVPPWQPSSGGLDEKYAQVTQQMAVEVDSLGAAKATWGLYLDVNGRIVGMQSINDGVVGELNFMADVFRLLSPAGADGMEIQDGYIRIWKGNSQTIIGNSFGVAGQKLMRWFGPNIGAAACSKANATVWEDSDGNAYFGGALSAGILKQSVRSTQISGSASVDTGVFSTNGRPKVVTFSVDYAASGILPAPPWSGGGSAQPVSVRMTLQRRLGGGAWTDVNVQEVSGTRFYVHDPETGYSASISCARSVTITDTNPSTGTWEYRVALSNASGWPVTLSATDSQTLSLLSVEE